MRAKRATARPFEKSVKLNVYDIVSQCVVLSIDVHCERKSMACVSCTPTPHTSAPQP